MRHSLAASILAALTLAACGGSDDSAGEPTAKSTIAASTTTEPMTTSSAVTTAPTTTVSAPATTAETTDPAPTTTLPDDDPAVLAPPTVHLIDAGAEPREIRRLAYAPGTYTLRMTQTQTITQAIDGEEVTVGPIATIIDAEVVVESAPEGFLVTTTITNVAAGEDTDPAIASSLEQSLSAMVGFTSTALIDDRGQLIRPTELDLPETIPPELSTLVQGLPLDQLSSPLPAEPIGVGAQWSVVQELDQAGISVTQTLVHELTAIEGQLMVLAVSSSASAALGPVELLGMPEGFEADLKSFDTTTSSGVDYDLTRPLQASSSTSESTLSMTISGDRESSTLDQHLTMTMTIEPG